jgi:hypothetical protein
MADREENNPRFTPVLIEVYRDFLVGKALPVNRTPEDQATREAYRRCRPHSTYGPPELVNSTLLPVDFRFSAEGFALPDRSIPMQQATCGRI